MKCDGELILEYKHTGVVGGSGEVFLHQDMHAERIYMGPAAYAIYQSMKRFIRARHAGSGEWFEENTEQGMKWRERPTSNVYYEPMDEPA
jgi:hypothetical protein